MKLRCLVIACSLLISVLCSGCSGSGMDVKKVKDLNYTVLGMEEQPETLKGLIEERKQQAFNLTYSEGEFMYICVGYGEQPTGGYSIQVEDCYEGEEVIYVNTTLLGPTTEDQIQEEQSYPYIVLKTEYLDKTVVFE